MNVVKEISKLNEEELRLGISDEKSWHAEYRGSAWVFVGGLPFKLSEGDVICVFSQWGEIEDLHLVRDEESGRSKGFAFLKYENWKSTVLAVDNLNGVELLGRTLRVDHKLGYEPPKAKQPRDANGKVIPTLEAVEPKAMEPGHAYKAKELASDFDIHRGVNIFSVGSSGQKEGRAGEAAAAAGGHGSGPLHAPPVVDPENGSHNGEGGRLPSNQPGGGDRTSGRGGGDREESGHKHRHHHRRHHGHHHRHHRRRSGSRERSEDGPAADRRREEEGDRPRHRRSRSRSAGGGEGAAADRVKGPLSSYSRDGGDRGATSGGDRVVGAVAPGRPAAPLHASSSSGGVRGGGGGSSGDAGGAMSWRGRLEPAAAASAASGAPFASRGGGGRGGGRPYGGQEGAASGGAAGYARGNRDEHVAGLQRRR